MRKSTIFGLTAGLALSAGLVFAATNISNPAPLAEEPVDGEMTYVLTPEDGAIVNDLMTVSLEFPTVKNVEFYENMTVAMLVNENTGTTYTAVPDRNPRAMTEGIVYNFTFIENGEEEATPITEPGNYTLSIKGAYLAGEENIDLPWITATYTVEMEYNLTPASGSVVEDLMKVSIEFPTAKNVGFYENMTVATLVNENTGTTYTAEPLRDTRAMTEGIVYDFTFVENGEEMAAPITEPGQYTLSIKGAYLAGGEGEENVDLPWITATYTVAMEYNLTPAAGSIVEDLMKVSIEFPTAKNVGFYENMTVATLVNESTGTTYTAEPLRDTRAMTEGIVYDFTFIENGEEMAAPITEPGQYTLSIKGAYLAGGEGEENVDLPWITATYTVGIEYNLTPASGSVVEDLMKVSIEFPTAKNIGFYENMTVATLVNESTGTTYTAEPFRDTRAMTEGIVYDFTFIENGEEMAAPITEPGQYTLSIKGAYLAGGEGEENVDLPWITATYTVAMEYNLTPAAGSIVEDLMKVSIEFPTTKFVGFYENMTVATLVNESTGTTYTAEPFRDTRAMTEGIVYDFTFIENGEEFAVPITEPGYYTLSIKGAYLSGEENIDLPWITAQYIVIPAGFASFNPESGSTVESLSTVTVTFDAANIGLTEGRGNEIVLENLSTGATYYGAAMKDTKAEGQVYNITFGELGSEEEVEITEVGNYVLTLRGIYTSTIDEDGEESDPVYLPAVTAEYTVLPAGFASFNPAKGSTVESLSTITVTFDAANVGLTEGRSNEIVLENLTTGDFYYGVASKDSKAEGQVYNITFTELGSDEELTIDEIGNYVLTIRGIYTSTIGEDGEESDPIYLPVITADYTIIPADFASFTPVSGTTVENLNSITVSFEGKVGFTEGRGNEIVLENTTTGEVYSGVATPNTKVESEGSVYTLTFTELGGEEEVEVSAIGNYVLTLRGLYTTTIDEEGEESDPAYLPVITAEYTVLPVDFASFNPASGSTVESLSNITVTFDAMNVGLASGRGNEVLLENTTTGTIYTGVAVKDGKAEGQVYNISFAELGGEEVTIDEIGNYVLRLAGFYMTTMDEEGVESEPAYLPVITAEYTVLPADFVTFDPENGSTVQNLNAITVSFASKVGITTGRGTEIVLENASTGAIYSGVAIPSTRVESEGSQYTITFTELGGGEEVEITEVGGYILTLRGLYMTTIDEEGEESDPAYLPVITAEYTVLPADFATFTPESGSTVQSLSTITVSFNGNVGFAGGRGNEIVLENASTGDIYYGVAMRDTKAESEGSVYNITFAELGSEEEVEITTMGEYVLTLRGFYASAIDEEGEESDPVYLPVLTAAYTIAPVYYLTPASGSTVESLSTITLTFDDTNIGYTSGRGNEIVLENNSTGDYYYGVALRDTKAEGTVYNITFTELGSEEEVEITTIGEYTLTLRGFFASSIDEDGVESENAYLPVLTASYTLLPADFVTLDPASGSTVGSLSTIAVTFNAANVGFTSGRGNEIVLENTSTGDFYYGVANKDTKAEGQVYNITFAELGSDEELTIDEIGNYVLTIRGIYTSTIGEDGEESDPIYLPAITAEYTVLPEGFATFDPASGSTVENLNSITVSFEGKVGVTTGRGNEIVLENTTTGEVYSGVATPNTRVESEGSEYTITFTELGGEEEVEVSALGNYVLTLRGLYTTTIDEDGEESDPAYLPVITAEYTVLPEGFVTFDPANGSTVESLSNITVTFDAMNVGLASGRGNEVLLENTSTGTIYTGVAVKDGKAEGQVYNITFAELGSDEELTIDEIGNYVLRLAGFYMTTIDEEGDESEPAYLPVITAEYSVLPADFVTFDPASGSTVETLSTVTVTFDAMNVGLASGRGNEIVLENLTTGDFYYGEAMKDTKAEGQVYNITFAELGSDEAMEITTAGEYVLSLRGFYMTSIDEEGDESEPAYLPVLKATYTLTGSIDYTLDPVAGSEVEEISIITLTINGDPMAGIRDMTPAPVVLENVTTGSVWYCESPMKSRLGDGSSAFKLEFTELNSSEIVTIVEEGEYLLTVRGLYTSVLNEDETETDTDLPNIYATYYVVNGTTGIDQFIDADTYNVYGINGIQVIRDGKASDLNSLTPGLYIINGKKVYIRK